MSPGRSSARVIIAALAAGEFLVALDINVLTVALPSIQRTFNAGILGLQWAVIAYMIAGAALAVPFGALGDRLGRRRLYIVGMVIFAVGSAVSACAPHISILIAGRAVQGVGSAAMGTLALAMLVTNAAPGGIPRLVGLWTAVATGAAAIGPIVGGGLVEVAGWRWVFLINVLLLVVLIPIVIKEVPQDSVPAAAGDRVGFLAPALLTVAIMLMAGGATMLERQPWSSPWVWGSVAAGLLAIAIVVIQQRRTDRPFTDWGALRHRPVPATLVVMVVLGMTLAGSLLPISMLAQNVLGLTPIIMGLSSFCASVALMTCSPLAARVLLRLGLGPTIGLGLLITAAGLIGLSQISLASGPLFLSAWFAVLGVGLGLGMTSASSGALSSVPRSSVGAVSGFLNLVGSVAAVLGIALLGAISAIIVSIQWAELGTSVSDWQTLTDEVVSGAIPQIRDLAGAQAAALAGQSYLAGVRGALMIAGVTMAVMAFVVAPMLGLRGRTSAAAETAAAEAAA